MLNPTFSGGGGGDVGDRVAVLESYGTFYFSQGQAIAFGSIPMSRDTLLSELGVEDFEHLDFGSPLLLTSIATTPAMTVADLVGLMNDGDIGRMTGLFTSLMFDGSGVALGRNEGGFELRGGRLLEALGIRPGFYAAPEYEVPAIAASAAISHFSRGLSDVVDDLEYRLAQIQSEAQELRDALDFAFIRIEDLERRP